MVMHWIKFKYIKIKQIEVNYHCHILTCLQTTLELFPVVHYILCLRRTPHDNKIYILVIRINHESDRTIILRINNLSTEIYPELKGHIPVYKS